MSEQDDFAFWAVERFIDLGNETFWHETSRILQHNWETDKVMLDLMHQIGARDVLKHGGTYRIRVYRESTLYTSD